MTISDFFNTSFLFSVALIIILTGCVFVYINYKMAEQDHKLSSMVNLVSVLAQDLQFVKNRINVSQYVDPNILQYQSQMIGGENNSGLISVSDGEDEDLDEEDDDEDLDEEDDDEDLNEEELNEDEEDEDNNNIENTQEHIKLLNLSLANDDVEHNLHIEEINTEELNTNDSSNMVDIKTIHIDNVNNDNVNNDNVNNDNVNNNNETDFEENENSTSFEYKQLEQTYTDGELNFLKNVSITDLGDIQDFLTTKPEYKKFSINKLREVVVNKGIVADASKLKKHEILKLLGDD